MGWGGERAPAPLHFPVRNLLADCEMRWEPPTDRLGWEQAALGPCSQVPVPCPWAFPGYSPGGCGKPTRGPRGARETAEGAAAGKSQGKGWRRPVVGSSAFPHEEPSVLTPQESELSKKRKKCQSLEQEARKKQRRCEELVSSGGPPRGPLPRPPGQPGGGLPLRSAFILLALRSTLPLCCGRAPFLADAGTRRGRKALTGRAGSSVWGGEECGCQASFPELLWSLRNCS